MRYFSIFPVKPKVCLFSVFFPQFEFSITKRFLHFDFRYSKKPSMSPSIRLCTHNCANFSWKRRRISTHPRATPAPSSVSCSKSAKMSSRTVSRLPKSTRNPPPTTSWRRIASTWPSEKCLATSSSWVNWASLKLFMTPSYTDAVSSSWSAAKNNLFPTRRKTWSVCATS